MIAVWLAPAAWAQSPLDPDFVLPEVASDLFRPSVDGGPWLATESAHTDPGDVIAGAHLSWANRPLTWTPDDPAQGDQVDIVSNALALHLGARVTLGPVELGAAAPAYLHTTGLGFDGSTTVLGDPTLQAKVGLSTVDLAGGALVKVGLPLGGASRQVGTPGPFWELGLLGQASVSSLQIGLNLGVRGVPEQTLDGTTVDDHLWGRLGVAWLVTERWIPALELVGQRRLSDGSASTTPLEMSLQLQHQLAAGPKLHVGVGPGLGNAVGTPSWRAVAGVILQRGPTSE
ncbi:MAG: hypothetical protein KTR31_39290 [Myxococcales bacterium]|nr:hypothetical protein [Myxococcales bacterium]